MTPEKSLYDLAKVVFAGQLVMLREHFRCVATIIEFSKRLDASVFFDAVTPDKGKADVDKGTGITYYTFTITGKVVY
jgi:hypothetical protein